MADVEGVAARPAAPLPLGEAEGKRCSLLRDPTFVAYHAGAQIAAWSADGARYVWERRHAVLAPLLGLAAVVALAHALATRSEALAVQVAAGDAAVAYVVWWVGLGILSSVGLGTGLHSGVLFAFPHVTAICLAAERCGSTDFDTTRGMPLRRALSIPVTRQSESNSPFPTDARPQQLCGSATSSSSASHRQVPWPLRTGRFSSSACPT